MMCLVLSLVKGPELPFSKAKAKPMVVVHCWVADESRCLRARGV